jgi:hypothetical protein
MNESFGIMNFVVGTSILYGLTYLVIVPITRMISNDTQSNTPKLNNNREQNHIIGIKQPNERQPNNQIKTANRKPDVIDQLSTGSFILVSIIILGIVGVVFGLAVFDIIGIAKKGKMWPGLIVMAICCIIGGIFHEGRIFGHSF